LIMCRLIVIWMLLFSADTGQAQADPGRKISQQDLTLQELTQQELRELAIKWLRDSMAFIACDEQHFIYGVGYIDGSYMERIFYVRGGGDRPALSVRFRDEEQAQVPAGGDIGALQFVMEINSPKVLSASLSNGRWRVSDEGWETALRFKYTSWYGTVSRQDGQWNAEWQGYRRPMLPASVTDHVGETCGLFAGR